MRRTTDAMRPLTAHAGYMPHGPRAILARLLVRLRRRRSRLDQLTAADRARIGDVGRQDMRAALESVTDTRRRR